MKIFINWLQKRLSEPQVAVLIGFIVVGAVLIFWIGDVLAPIFAAVIIAYLLEGLVRALQRRSVPRRFAVWVAFFPFLIVFFLCLLVVLPLLYRQIVQLFQQLPSILTWGKDELMALPDRYPELVSSEQIAQVMNMLQSRLGEYGEQIISFSLASIRSLINFVVYLVVVPLMVFFMLRDKEAILAWFSRFMPADNRLVVDVWREVDQQIGNYVRGKFIEIIIVWGGSSMIFSLLGLQAAVLFGLFVGLSVLIPYIGAAVMTFPIAVMAFFQWGFSADFFYVMIAYGMIQLVDGNILATYLFSEVVHLHPLAILAAVVVSGGLGGFWGVFFAIPLATMIKAVIQAWPSWEGGSAETGRQAEDEGQAKVEAG